MTAQKEDLILTRDELKSIKTGLSFLKTRSMSLIRGRHLITSDKMMENLEGILKKYQAV